MPSGIRPQDWTPADGLALEPAAEEAVRASSNTVVVAGPGAGKTEMLAQRACYLLQTGLCPIPKRILAISFKRDAARNLGDRVAKRSHPDLARRFDSLTFDAFAKSLLDRFGRALPEHWRPSGNYEIEFAINEGKAREILESISPTSGLSAADVSQIAERRFYRETFLARLPESRRPPSNTEERAAAILWRRFLHGRQPSKLNFEMIGRLAELLLRANPKILAALRSTYSFVFLDEFQDTTGIQYDVVLQAFHGSSAVLTAVGDNKQRIMGWAHALEGIFAKFQADFRASDIRPVLNYRSAPELVRIQQVIAHALDKDHKDAVAANDGSVGGGECEVFLYKNHLAEAAHLAGLIEGWIVQDGLAPRSICVLTRKTPPNYTSHLTAELAKRSIKARVESEMQDLLAEPITTVLLHFFKLSSSRRSPESWAALIELVQEIGSDDSEQSYRNSEKKLAAFRRRLGHMMSDAGQGEEAIRPLVEEVLKFVHRPDFVSFYTQYRQGKFLDDILGLFVKHFALCRNGRDWPSAIRDFEGVDSVPIMTMHKSKGLEYHTIVFVGLEDSALFNWKEDAREEGCGFFVAFSRAKMRVIFTFSEQRPRKIGGPAYSQDRSNIKLLYDILEAAGVRFEEIG